MKKILFIIIVILVVIVSTILIIKFNNNTTGKFIENENEDENNNSWLTYHNQISYEAFDYSYSFQYPPNWLVRSPDPAVVLLQGPVKEEYSETAEETIFFSFEERFSSLEDYWKKWDIENISFLKEKIIVDGVTGDRVVGRYTTNESEQIFDIRVAFMRNGMIFTIFQITPSSYSLEIFDKVISSLKFTTKN